MRAKVPGNVPLQQQPPKLSVAESKGRQQSLEPAAKDKEQVLTEVLARLHVLAQECADLPVQLEADDDELRIKSRALANAFKRETNLTQRIQVV